MGFMVNPSVESDPDLKLKKYLKHCNNTIDTMKAVIGAMTLAGLMRDMNSLIKERILKMLEIPKITISTDDTELHRYSQEDRMASECVAISIVCLYNAIGLISDVAGYFSRYGGLASRCIHDCYSCDYIELTADQEFIRWYHHFEKIWFDVNLHIFITLGVRVKCV